MKLGSACPDWSPDEDNELRALWARGLSAGDIAARLVRRNRNAVMGRAFRLDLPRRPSPIPPPRHVTAQQRAADAEYARSIARAARGQTDF